jgi:hypothetical protein
MKKDNFMYNKGMNKDNNPLFKPEGTYQFALNALLGTKEGDTGTISNEEGNIACGDVPGNYSVIGSVQLDDNKTVLFITNNITSILGIYNPDKCGFDNLIVSNCMNLRTDKQVDALFRIVRGCERTVYFTDGYNPYKSVNIDRLEDYLADGFTNVKDANDDPVNGWNCIKMNHFLYYTVPCINFDSIIEGQGNLQVGTYQFAIRYLDRNLNPTNWIYVSNIIPIIDDSLSNTYGAIDGHQSSTNRYNKSISLIIDELDYNFNYVQLAALESVNGIGTVTNAYILEKVAFTSTDTSVNYTYGGFNPNIHQLFTVGGAITPNILLNTVEAHEQTDNRLLLANVSTYTEDWANLQRLATLVDVKWITKDIEIQNDKQDSKYPLYYYDTMSYMRDEVYALGIVYVFYNGTESPVFHIPGRTKDIVNTIDLNTVANSFTNTHYRGAFNVPTEWDTHLLQVVNDGMLSDPENEVEWGNVQHIPLSEFVNCNTITTNACIQSTITFDVTPTITGLDFNIPALPAGDELNARIIIKFGLADDATYADEVHHFFDTTTVVSVPAGFDCTAFDCTITVETTITRVGNCIQRQHNTKQILKVPTTIVMPTNLEFGANISNTNLCKIERWRVYNTAVNIDANTGYMAYNEAHLNYPEIKDCNDISIWDATAYGGDNLTLTPIRHHRFPDCALYNQEINTYNLATNASSIKPIGLRYDITNLVGNLGLSLTDKLKGFYFVRVKRDVYNKTIFEKIHSNIISVNGFGGNIKVSYVKDRGSVRNISNEIYSNDITYFNNINSSQYIKLERYYSASSYFNTTNFGFNAVGTPSFVSPVEYNAYFQLQFRPEAAIDFSTLGVHRNITASAVIPYNSTGTLGTANYINIGGGQQTGIVQTFPFAAAYPYRDNYLGDNTSGQTIASDWAVAQADYENTGASDSYISLKVYRDVYTNIDSLIYNRTHNCIILLTDLVSDHYNGDTFITQSLMLKTKGILTGTNKFIATATQGIFFIESEMNSALRHVEIYSDRYAPKTVGISPYLRYDGENLIRDSSLIPIDINDTTEYREFTYSYNRDYSKLNTENIYLPLPFTYAYCDKCNTVEPYTIYWSEKSQADSVNDSYKIILASNSTKIPSDTGRITNLFIEKDNLFCHVEKALWALQTRPQELQTSDAVINVGTGEFLSTPPRRLITTPYGYGGSLDKFATTGTQFGTFFIDRNSRKVFIFGEGLEEISLNGMEQWFETELRIKFIDQFRAIPTATPSGLEYPVRHTTDINSVGYQCVYDPRYDRIILHKRDFLIREDINYNGNTPKVNNLYYQITGINNDVYQWTYDNGSTLIEVAFDNTDYFENHSWTLSYDLKKKCWVSFHSYQPNFMFNDHFTYYTFINQFNVEVRDIWKHNVRNYQTYYDVKYDHILEIVLNNDAIQEKIFGSMQLISNSYKYSNVGDYYIQAGNTTFDRFLIYNEYQSSHIRDLIVKLTPYQSLSLAVNETLIDRTDNYWRFNRFRDITIDRDLVAEPLITDRWLDIIAEYDSNGQGFIDYISNPNAIDVAKSPYQQSRFRDKYAVVRLFYKPEEEYKIVTDIMSTLNNPAIR